MKERPILFSAPMVRAILAGSKTQTRRVVKALHPDCHESFIRKDDGLFGWRDQFGRFMQAFPCPYGQPGERLWVRENGWERPDRTPKMMREGADTWAPYYFDADYEFDATRDNEFAEFKEWGFKRRPSIHMPRWASRILLEITAVRVDRLQDISEADAVAEGCRPDAGLHGDDDMAVYFTSQAFDNAAVRICATPMPVVRYAVLWKSINGAGSWAANPWVWVVEFKRVTP